MKQIESLLILLRSNKYYTIVYKTKFPVPMKTLGIKWRWKGEWLGMWIYLSPFSWNFPWNEHKRYRMEG